MITGYSNKDQYLGRYGDRECFRIDLSGWDAKHPNTCTFSVPHDWYKQQNHTDIVRLYQDALIDGVVEYEDMN